MNNHIYIKIKYPLLIPVIGHGATDIIDKPVEAIFYNIFIGILMQNINLVNRKRLLTSFSIFHIAQDFPSKFNYFKLFGENELGFMQVVSSPLTRSSYHAEEIQKLMKKFPR